MRSQPPSAPGYEPAGNTATSQESIEEDSAGLLGVLVAERSIELSAERAGRLLRLPVRLGEPVAKGAVLATLDSRQLNAERQEADAAIASAKAQLTTAKVDLERTQALSHRRSELVRSTPAALSQDEWERTGFDAQLARARLIQREAELDQRRAHLLQVESLLAATELLAPWSGVVAARYVAEGATVGIGQPLLRLISAGSPLLRFAAPPSTLLRVGQKVCIALPGGGRTIAAYITQIAPEIDDAIGLLVVEAHLYSPLPAELRAGEQVTVDLGCKQSVPADPPRHALAEPARSPG